MELTLVSGSASAHLAAAVAAELGVRHWSCQGERFPDGELHVRVPSTLRGDDVYLIQSTGPPADANLVELLLLLDACRRAGAARLTAVVPYLGYARQDRRTAPGEAVGLKVVAEVIGAAGTDRLLVVDPHTPVLESVFDLPVEQLTAVPLLASAVATAIPADAVVVAPDQGAVKLAGRYAAVLDRPVAVVAKRRLSGEHVEATAVTGDVDGRAAVIVDDMISTAGTIAAAVAALLQAGARAEVTVAATHGLLVGPARDRLRALPLRRVIVTDTLATTPGGLVQVTPVAPLLGRAIGRLYRQQPLDDLAGYG